MNNYYYIWFETFINGKSAGKGRYWKSGYKYKKNAERRAKQMWGDGPFHDPMTGEIIEHRWTVSQTNPFDASMTPEDDIIHCEDCLHCYKTSWSKTGYKCCIWGRDTFACDVPLAGYCYRAKRKTYKIREFPTNSEP